MKKRRISALELEYTLHRSKRKTLSISIDPTKGVIVRSPQRMSITEIERFIHRKQGWIFSKIGEFDNIPLENISIIKNGGSLQYRGRKLTLVYQITNQSRIQIELIGEKLLVKTCVSDEKAIRRAIERWYRQQALMYIKKRVDTLYNSYFEKIVKTEYTEIKVRYYKRRWGSANSDGILRFNWRLIMAPDNIIEYVVIHELTHLIYFDHSKKYWEHIAKFYPEYKEIRKWLRLNGHLLFI